MKENPHEINIIHMDEFCDRMKDHFNKIVEQKKIKNFKGYIKVTTFVIPRHKITLMPISGTEIDWVKRLHEDSGIDVSQIFEDN